MEYKDYYWLNDDSRTFLKRGYLDEGIEPEQRYRQIAETAQKILGIEGFADKFEGFLKKGFYSLSSPVISNFGQNKGLPVSCYHSTPADSIESILYKTAEVGVMTKVGGGTSGYFGNIRPRGSKISIGGISDGPVRFMELFDKTTSVVSQSNVRRGSFAAYLPIEHPDIEDFLLIREEGNPIQEMSLGVTITDAWMESMLSGDIEKRKLWGKIIKKRFESGYPYIFFTDTVNCNAPQVYKDKGLKVNASNLCVTGDTLVQIMTDTGIEREIRIQDLGFYMKRFKTVKVKSFDVESQEVVYSTIKAFAQTGESTEIIEIQDENGNVLKCTPEHKIFTKNRGYVEAQNLKEDDILENLVN